MSVHSSSVKDSPSPMPVILQLSGVPGSCYTPSLPPTTTNSGKLPITTDDPLQNPCKEVINAFDTALMISNNNNHYTFPVRMISTDPGDAVSLTCKPTWWTRRPTCSKDDLHCSAHILVLQYNRDTDSLWVKNPDFAADVCRRTCMVLKRSLSPMLQKMAVQNQRLYQMYCSCAEQ
jgi:hypothetical protein